MATVAAPAPAPAGSLLPSTFQLSTQWRRWQLNEGELARRRREANERARAAVRARATAAAAPNGDADLDALLLLPEDEVLFVRYYTHRLSMLCDRALKLPATIRETAVTYLKRFYLAHSIMDYHPKTVLLTALFLACKTEERYYNAQQFATLVRQGPELVDDLLALEHTLIEAIQFDLGVQHPCTALHGLILDARAEAAGVTLDQVRTAAAALLARAVQADVLFEHTPAQVALACFLRACAGAPATQTASMRYLSGIVPDEAEQNALLETVRRIQQAIDDHGDVSDETARGIDQKLQRLQTVAPRPRVGEDGAADAGDAAKDEDAD